MYTYLIHLCGGKTDEDDEDSDGDAMRMATARDALFQCARRAVA